METLRLEEILIEFRSRIAKLEARIKELEAKRELPGMENTEWLRTVPV